MTRGRRRYEAVVDGGEMYVPTDGGRVRIVSLDGIVSLVGGAAWEITYTDRQKRRYPDLDTSDEGLTVHVVDVVNAMAMDGDIVDALARLPAELSGGAAVSPRTGLFVGRLLGYLETGLE